MRHLFRTPPLIQFSSRCSCGKFAAAAVTALLVVFLTAFEAHAQSRSCRQLSVQLASLNTGSLGETSPQYREFDDAVRQQQIQLSKTRRIAERSGCLRRTLFGLGKKSGRCGRILDGVKRMESNLAGLKRARAGFAPRQAGNSRDRQRIIRRMQNRGCDNTEIAGTSQTRNEKSRRRTLVEQIFGVRTYGEDGRREANERDSEAALTGRSGTFRTLCVRTCDGYYFPISFSTVPRRFEQDAQICQAMCPGSEVLLYHHRMPSEDSEDMVSYQTQISYAQQPYAFNYRKKVNPECGCRFSTANISQGEETSISRTTNASNGTPAGRPVFRPDPALDPDTQENRDGNLTFDVMALLLKKSPANDTTELADASKRKVRIVGPAFFPVQ